MKATSVQKQFRALVMGSGLALCCAVSVFMYFGTASQAFAQDDQLTLGGYVDFGTEEEVEQQVEEQLEEELADTVSDDVDSSVQDSAEEQVAEQVQDSVEEQLTLGGYVDFDEVAEEEVEEQVEEAIDEQVADRAEETVEESVVDETEQAVEEQVADSTEEAVDEVTEAAIEEQVVTTTEEEVEEQVAEVTEEQVEQNVTDDVEEQVQADVQETVEQQTEEQVAENVEEAVEASVEVQVADASEESVEDATSEVVEEQIAEAAEEQVSEQVADVAEAQTEEVVAETTEAVVEEQVAESTAEVIEETVEVQVADAATSSVEGSIVSATEEALENTIDEMIDDIESDIDLDEQRIHKGQWLVMAEPQVFEELAEEGYLFDSFTELPGLGLRLAEVAAPASFDVSLARDGILDVVGGGRAEVDLNHIYTAGAPETTLAESGVAPHDAMPFPQDVEVMPLKIGIIDSAIDSSHTALVGSHIETRDFVTAGSTKPNFHGTAIASIFSANDPIVRGLAPQATLYAASVFEQDQEQGEIASTVSLVKALDWLASTNVDAVNLSLAGPPNRLLEIALKRVSQKGVMVLAAAGNGGPMAKPMYPAAYDTVVAVTAVDVEGKAFRLANRGDYLDLAAPGVNVRHALAGGGYATSSGTSFAVPFAVTAAASHRYREPGSDVLAYLYASATDIGPPGRDSIYGYGLLMP